MEYTFTGNGNNRKEVKVEVYNQKLQLIFRGQMFTGKEPEFKGILNECSLLFDLQDTRYFLQKN